MSDETVTGLTTVNLAGRITAGARASVAQAQRVFILAGRISAASKAGAQGKPFIILAGHITASSRTIAQATLSRTTLTLAGQITAAAQINVSRALFPLTLAGRITARSTTRGGGFIPYLAGRIHAQSTAQAQRPLFPTGNYLGLAGQISARSHAWLRRPDIYPLSVGFSGNIFSSSAAQLAQGPFFKLNLAGRIGSTAMLAGLAAPWQPILVGQITAAARAFFAIAEIQQPLPPYPPPFLTFNTVDYLNRITSEHNQKPKYYTTVGVSVDPVVQDQQLVAGVAGLFDLDYCVGQQEDFTGQWIGKSRWIELPAVFFSWDEEGIGWNQGNWKGPADAATTLERLDDYHFRLLLYATIIANHWNGSIPAAYQAWDTLFQYTGIKVLIQDYGNMTMLYGILSTEELDAVLVSLFLSGQMDLRPEGVELLAYALQPQPGAPFFAWDAASDAVSGWDTGQWAVMHLPGQPL
jgi:hypothetical protein